MTRYQRWKSRLRTRRKLLAAARAVLKKAQALVARRQAQVAEARREVSALEPVEKAVRWALAQEGTTERPANSNRGPEIDVWQRAFGMLGQPWCGAFVGFALRQGGIDVTNRIVYTPYILNDAKGCVNGFAGLVPLESCQRGDLVLMDFAPGGPAVMHVGMATEDYQGKGVVRTIEGNTSSGTTGSQDNGGGVFVRTRARGVIVGCARPRWNA